MFETARVEKEFFAVKLENAKVALDVISKAEDSFFTHLNKDYILTKDYNEWVESLDSAHFLD